MPGMSFLSLGMDAVDSLSLGDHANALAVGKKRATGELVNNSKQWPS